MKYAIVLGFLLFTGCHMGEAVSEISRIDPATGKSVGQEIAERALKAAGDPYNIENWLAVGGSLATLLGIAIYGKKSAAKHNGTKEAVESLVAAVSKSEPAKTA